MWDNVGPPYPSSPRGKVTGLRARGAFEVDTEWEKGKLREAVIRSKLGRSCRARCGEKVTELATTAGVSYTLGGDLAPR